MKTSHNFFHIFDSPSVGMFARCAKFQVGECVVVPHSVLMMHSKSLLAKPQNGFASHRVLLVKHEPMFKDMVSCGQRVSRHTSNDYVTSRSLSAMPYPVVLNSSSHRRCLGATLAKAAEPLQSIRRCKKADCAARGAFKRNAFLQYNSSTRVTQVLRATYLAIAFVFVAVKGSCFSASRAGYFPLSVAMRLFGDWCNRQQKWLKCCVESARGLIRHNESISFCLAALDRSDSRLSAAILPQCPR